MVLCAIAEKLTAEIPYFSFEYKNALVSSRPVFMQNRNEQNISYISSLIT